MGEVQEKIKDAYEEGNFFCILTEYNAKEFKDGEWQFVRVEIKIDKYPIVNIFKVIQFSEK